ncbi:unnamed protein product, partial [Effrenium voratum]
EALQTEGLQAVPSAAPMELESEAWRAAVREEVREALKEELREQLAALSVPLPATVSPPLRELLRSGTMGTMGTAPNTPGIGAPLHRGWTREISEESDDLFEWKRHPRKLRTNSHSPKRRKGSKAPHAPRMPEAEKLIRSSRRFAQMSNPLLLAEPAEEGWLASIVESPEFSGIVGAAILCNACTIGLQTEYAAQGWHSQVPPAFIISEMVFTVIFLVELLLRLCVYGRTFFRGPERGWNIFDMVLISAQVVDQVISTTVIIQAGGFDGLDLSQLTDETILLRALRIFRLLRILRILRIMHISGELQAIMTAVAKGMRSFIWTVVFLFLVLYAVGVFLTQSVTDYKVALAKESQVPAKLEGYFGTLPSTMLALFQAVTDGQEWRDMLEPLIEEISPWMAIPFCMYVAFTAFALLNILTGIFVDSALQNGQDEKRRFLLREVGLLFRETHKDQISWPDFQAQLENPHMQQLFAALDVDEVDAHELFHMLDSSHEGKIQADEFLNGCLRLDGPAKAIDLAAFMEESRNVNRTFLAHAQFVNSSLAWIVGGLRPRDGTVSGHEG